MNCLLCHTTATLFASDVFLCNHCGLLFKNPSVHYNSIQDFNRYATHKNNELDQGYIEFLNKLLIPLAQFLPEQFIALDFGCGPGPTLSGLLSGMGGAVENYDPLFFPADELLNKKYDVVTSSEVVEHFKNPDEHWPTLVALVKPGGLLGIMTLLFGPTIDYKSWWYKNDPTHVVFYQEKTLHYLADKFNLEILFNDHKSVVVFRKKIEG